MLLLPLVAASAIGSRERGSAPLAPTGLPTLLEGGANSSGEYPIPVSRFPLTLFQTDRSPPEGASAWLRANPNMKYVFMNDTDADAYLRTSWSARHAAAFAALKIGAIKADFLRLAYLADRGGFYVDTDQSPGEMSLEEVRERVNNQMFLGYASAGGLGCEGCPADYAASYFTLTGSVPYCLIRNDFMAAVPRHPELLRLVGVALERIESRFAANGTFAAVLQIAGPALLGRSALPQELLQPDAQRLTTRDDDAQRGFWLFNRSVMRDLGAEQCGARAKQLGCYSSEDYMYSDRCSEVRPACLNLTTCPFVLCKPGCGDGAANMASPRYWVAMADRGEVYHDDDDL